MAKRILVLAGHRRSLAAIALVHALADRLSESVVIGAVFCVSEYSSARLLAWRRRLGANFSQRVRQELGLARKDRSQDERSVLVQRLESRCISERKLTGCCSKLKIPLHIVANVNGAKCLKLLRRYDPDYVVYSGGGIIRQPLLDLVPGGVLNMHCGPLPHVRGMNAVEWSLFLGLQPEVTLHYIDAGIDTGRIVASRQVGIQHEDSLTQIRGRAVLAGIDLLVDSLPGLEAFNLKKNSRGSGLQYFTMARPVRTIVQHWLETGVTPVISASNVAPNDFRPAPMRCAQS